MNGDTSTHSITGSGYIRRWAIAVQRSLNGRKVACNARVCFSRATSELAIIQTGHHVARRSPAKDNKPECGKRLLLCQGRVKFETHDLKRQLSHQAFPPIASQSISRDVPLALRKPLSPLIAPASSPKGVARLSFTVRIGRVISFSLPIYSEAAGVVSIARIERPLFYRGRSASTETTPTVSPLPFPARTRVAVEPREASIVVGAEASTKLDDYVMCAVKGCS